MSYYIQVFTCFIYFSFYTGDMGTSAEYQGSHALLCHSYVATLVKSLSSCVGQSVGSDYKAFQTLQPNVPYRGLYINLM